MIERILDNGLRMRAEALEGGIIRLQAGGLDGYQPSLLERYGVIESLPVDPEWATQGTTLHSPDGGRVEITPELGVRACLAGGIEIATAPGTQPGTGPTLHGNRGCRVNLPIAPDEKLIGFGDQVRTRFLLNGQRDELWIRYPLKHVPVPLLMSSRGYGIFFNTTRRLHFDIGATDPELARFVIEKQYLDMYLIPGGTYEEILRGYCRLTGFPPLAPRKSFGLWLILHSKASGHEALQVARTLREEGIACDNLSFEPDWMEKRYDFSADKEWNAERFRGATAASGFRRGPDRMLSALERMGFAAGLWLCSRWDFTWEEERRLGTDACREGDPLDLEGIELSHFDENVGHKPIYMDENTRRDEAWFDHLKKFVDDGARFFKVDPAVLINEFPDRLYGNGCTDDEMHNIAFLLCSKQMAQDYEAHTGRRSYGISVAGWAGQQRFAGTWAGDTGGGPQPLAGILQDAAVGHAYATCDMKTDCVEGIHMGFLLPWALINSWSSFHYPGYQGDRYDSIYRDYSALRMQLLPYLYGLAHRASQTGKAIVRPLFMEHPETEAAYEELRQFYLGDTLLVSAYRGERLLLPAGRWYDWWTGAIIEGAWQETKVPMPPDRGGHLLLREGGLVPLGPAMPFVDSEPMTSLTWRVFPGGEGSSFRFYWDDGDSFAYREGQYGAATLTLAPCSGGWSLTWSDPEGTQGAALHDTIHTFTFAGLSAQATTVVDGQQTSLVLDPQNGLMILEGVPFGRKVVLQT